MHVGGSLFLETRLVAIEVLVISPSTFSAPDIENHPFPSSNYDLRVVHSHLK